MMTSTNSSLPGSYHQPSSELLTNWYAEQVVQGHILASHKVMLAGKRHLDDLKKDKSKDFPYVFDEEKGHRPIVFIESL
ncbi:hypothetical protein P7H20_26060 [Paenibacillus larvae]|nr:hypothetical protein [Paenibacillus larvae]MDT2277623.1 hypothetical protein [Paenibacillus larvae]